MVKLIKARGENLDYSGVSIAEVTCEDNGAMYYVTVACAESDVITLSKKCIYDYLVSTSEDMPDPEIVWEYEVDNDTSAEDLEVGEFTNTAALALSIYYGL